MGSDGTSGADRPEGKHMHAVDPATLQVIGKPWRKVDARSRVTGQTRFADDLKLPRMLFCKLLRSTVAHARIVSVDTSAAEALPGVHAVLRGEELPNTFGILPVSQDEHTLCYDKVRFIGDPVVAIAAVDEDTAWDACRLVKVEYEKLDVVTDVFEAAKQEDNRIHDYGRGGNLHRQEHLEFGDMDAGFAESDLVREDVFFFEGNTHLPMEEHSTLAFRDPDGKVTVMSSTQTPHYLHKALSKVLVDHVPAHKIRVIACPNGGGFGGKSDPFNHEIAAAALSIKTGRPVKITLTREEVFQTHRGRHPVLMKSRIGVTKTGRIKALDFETHLDGGAYGSYGTASTFYTGALQTVTYPVENYHFRGARWFTNKAPCGPKRGHGTPQPRFGLEVQLDKIAVELGINPAVLRRQNLVDAHSLTANWMRIGSMGLGTCIDKVVEGSGFLERWGKQPYGKGIGIACSSYLSGAGLPIYWNAMPHSGVQLKLDRSGLVTVFCGSTDIGQGSNSILAYIVAEVFGLEPQDLRIVTSDTDLTPVDLGSYSSRVTVMTGNAALQAAERAREMIVGPVADKLEVPKGRLTFAGGRVFDCEDPERGMSFAEAVQIAEAKLGTLGTTGSYRPPRAAARFKGGGVGPSPSYSYTAAIVEVDVDPETGIYKVPKIWVAHDIGRALNPALVVGQVEGSVYMGLGEAMMEEMSYRGNRFGVHKIPSMLEYKTPTSMEMPEVVTWIVEDPDPNGPFGAKEAGQGPLLPIMPAVANAVYDAVGVRVDEVPVTPEKVFDAMQKKARGQEGRYGPNELPSIEWPEPRRVRTPWQGGTGVEVEREATEARS
ncbi:MAG: molybdopterin-dependent oxidoreductase [Planctomycetota bacterium]|nr:molybdopterin-dependent oxidoreductase [Planctomycetota bacterium]MDA0933044.1 molybdopterin-dependent oxidoreductase [Planctomycetota bacterium]